MDIINEGVTSQGVQVLGYDALLQAIQTEMNSIYAQDGEVLNFDSETPDGQMTNIWAQGGTDSRELALEVYNSFDPDKCTGAVQDSRFALNYITRNGGTFTIQNIDITTNKTVELNGLDGAYNDVNAASYTVSDNAGNLWYLIDSVTVQAGTTSLPFRSQNYGLYQPEIGTITNQVTKVLGVTKVNNSIAPTTLGQLQESDLQFKIRRNRSTAIKGQNNYDAMLAQLLELDGVSDADIHINNTNTTDSTGTDPYTVWVIVEGGANTDIANVIYQNSSGLPTRGDVSLDVTAISGQVFPVKFDRANPIPLYIRFDFKLTTTLNAVDLTGIANNMAGSLIYELNETAETSRITEAAAEAINSNGGGGFALNVEISTDGDTWTDYIPSASIQDKFVVDSTRITINAVQQ